LNKRIFVFGADGQLGQCLQSLQPPYQFFTQKDLDFVDTSRIEAFFVAKGRPDVILNLAAYTQVDKAESEEALATQINGLAAGELAKYCTDYILISTDYVFSGSADRPYLETDRTAPLGAYGRSKLMGETLATGNNPRTRIVRTAWLYSDVGHNFLKTMLRLGAESDHLRIVNDQVGSPTSAYDLAEALITMVDRLPKVTPGVYHFTNEGQCSWFEFAKAIFELAGVTGLRIEGIPSSAYPTPAQRPKYSVLDKAKIKAALDLEIAPWQKALARVIGKVR